VRTIQIFEVMIKRLMYAIIHAKRIRHICCELMADHFIQVIQL